MKESAAKRKPVRGVFGSWGKTELLVRLGGNYVHGSQVLVRCGDDPVITLEASDESGLLELSFVLVDKHNDPIVVMQNNCMDAWPERIHDLDVTEPVNLFVSRQRGT